MMIVWKFKSEDWVGHPQSPYSSWRWVLDVRWLSINLVLTGKKKEDNQWCDRWLRVYAASVTRHFSIGHFHTWYDGPNCAFSVGWLHFFWNPYRCDRCEEEL